MSPEKVPWTLCTAIRPFYVLQSAFEVSDERKPPESHLHLILLDSASRLRSTLTLSRPLCLHYMYQIKIVERL